MVPLLLFLVHSSTTQPILPPYPGFYEYQPTPYDAYAGWPYGLTHFGTQSTYQMGMNPMMNPYGYNSFNAFNSFNPLFSGYQGMPQTPLTFDSNANTHPSVLDHAGFLSLVNDKDNFQAQGCGWDPVQMRCTDALGLCKGGCRDFATTTTLTAHDCRCIPYGYVALLKLMG